VRSTINSQASGHGYRVSYDRKMPSGAVIEDKTFAHYSTLEAAEAGADRLRNGPLGPSVAQVYIDEVELA
jgi:hypothetical protein